MAKLIEEETDKLIPRKGYGSIEVRYFLLDVTICLEGGRAGGAEGEAEGGRGRGRG